MIVKAGSTKLSQKLEVINPLFSARLPIFKHNKRDVLFITPNYKTEKELIGKTQTITRFITTRKLKLWTLFTHGFIIVGFGHGVIFFVLIKVFWFPYITNADFTFLFNAPFESRLPTVGMTTLLGQAALIFSIVTVKDCLKILFHIGGLVLLWLSILYFTYDINKEYSVYFAAITCIPFVITTIIAFLGQPIKALYNRIVYE